MGSLLIFIANIITLFLVAITIVFIGCYSAFLAGGFALLYAITNGIVSNELGKQ